MRRPYLVGVALGVALLVGGVGVACDRGTAVAVTTCALADNKLSVVFRRPDKARAYLLLLAERLDRGEPKAVEDAADLVRRVARCSG